MRDLFVLELKLLARNRGAMVLLAVFAALFALAIASGWQRESARAAAAQSLAQQDAGRLDGLRRELTGIESGTREAKRYGDPRQAGRIGRNLGARETVLPPAPLGWVAAGVSDLRPWHFTVSTAHRSAFADEYELRSPLELRQGALDLAFVIGWVMPLVILALGYDWLARDREAGRGRWLLSERGAPSRVAAGRLGALAMVPALVAFACGAAALAMGGPTSAAVALAALVLGYGALWIAFIYALNLWLARAATIAAALACLWLALCVLLPAAMDAGVRAEAPLPPRLALLSEERRVLVDAERRHSELLARYLHDHPEASDPKEKVDVPEFLLRSTIQNREIDALTAPLRVTLDDARARQQALLERLQWLSPTVVLGEALAGLAGNDARRHAAFERAVGDLHKRWSEHFLPLVLAKARFRAEDVDRLPRFAFEEPGGAAARAWGAALYLFALAGAVALLARWRRRDPVSISLNGRMA